MSMQLLIRNIRQLVTVSADGKRHKTGNQMRELGIIENGAVLVEDDLIRWVGPSGDLRITPDEESTVVDASEFVALPGFVDAHTHLLFAGSREDEFAMRVGGKTYQEIDSAGGGILSTMNATRGATKKELKKLASKRLDAMLQHGTTTAEVKTGYCLDEKGEVKLLEALRELEEEHYATIVPTFLGAHAIPPEFRSDPEAYVDLLCTRLLPFAAQRRLAQFCDAFCETNYFSVEQTRRIFLKASELGISLKIHADQLSQMGASKLGAEMNAVSVDHLENVNSDGIEAMKRSKCIAVVLPGVSFFLNTGYPPARTLIDSGVPLAIASNFNPGSCMSFSIPLMMTIACTHMHLTPEEAICAATLNAAAALNLSDRLGSIEVGKKADIILYDVPNYRHLAYHFGVNHVAKVIKNGTILEF